MAIEPSLVIQLQGEFKKDPVDMEMAKACVAEIVGMDQEPYTTNTLQLIDSITRLFKSENAKLLRSIEERKGLKPTKLALILQQYNFLLQDFEVHADVDGNNLQILYKDQSDDLTMYKAYDYLKIELAKYIGFVEFDYRTLSRAIMMAKNFLQYEEEFVTNNLREALVIEKAYFLLNSRRDRKLITIPDLKKTITSFTLTTKEFERMLLAANWEIVKSGSCATKFFRPLQTALTEAVV